MADNVTAGGNTISSEEVTTLNGGAVSAQHVQRVLTSFRSADGTAVDGTAFASTEATTMQSSAVAIGNGTSIDVSGMETLVLAVSGITTATIVVEGELPSGTWNTMNVKNSSGGALSTSITANGVYVVSVAGYLNVRARISVWTAGTIIVTGTATAAGNHAELQNVAMTQRLDPVNDSITAYPFGHSVNLYAADALIKTGAGVLHTVTFTCNDAAPTAGSIIFYDNTAESGTQLLNHTFTTTPFDPTPVVLDVAFTTGLYIGFTTTNDVNVTVSWR